MANQRAAPRTLIVRAFSFVEDVVYVGLGLLLAGGALGLLVGTIVTFVHSVSAGTLEGTIVALLDRILLILLVVELLYTVQVSLREHSVSPEPFLLVGLIAAVRRILVITAEFGESGGRTGPPVQQAIPELAVLTGLIVALAISLYALHKRSDTPAARRP